MESRAIRRLDFDSEAALLEWLRGGTRREILLRAPKEEPRRYFGFEVPVRGEGQCALAIGVLSAFHGVPPQCLVVESRAVALVGFDSSIEYVPLGESDAGATVWCGSAFYEMIEVPPSALVLGVFEAEVVGINYDGSVRWKVDLPDICGGVEVAGAAVVVRLWESGKRFVLSLDRGEIL